MDYFAGLDVSLEETSICIVDSEGRIVAERKVATDPPRACKVALKRVGLEAGPLSPL